jgi:hypothetical protein
MLAVAQWLGKLLQTCLCVCACCMTFRAGRCVFSWLVAYQCAYIVLALYALAYCVQVHLFAFLAFCGVAAA